MYNLTPTLMTPQIGALVAKDILFQDQVRLNLTGVSYLQQLFYGLNINSR